MFFYQGRNQKLAKKRGLDLTAISLSVSYKRWFGAKPFEINATVQRTATARKCKLAKCYQKYLTSH